MSDYRKDAVELAVARWFHQQLMERVVNSDTPPKEVLMVPELPLSECEVTQEDLKPILAMSLEWMTKALIAVSEYQVVRTPRTTGPLFAKPPEPLAATDTTTEEETDDADENPDAKKPRRKRKPAAEG